MKSLFYLLALCLIFSSAFVVAQLWIKPEAGTGVSTGTIGVNASAGVTTATSCETACSQQNGDNRELYDLCMQENCAGIPDENGGTVTESSGNAQAATVTRCVEKCSQRDDEAE